MHADQTHARTKQAQQAVRTGPVGRVARLLLAAASGWLAYDLWADRSFIFSDLDPGLMVVTAAAVYGLYHIAGVAGLAWQAMAATAVAAVGTATLAVALQGAVWASPLSPFIWGLDLVVLAIIGTALVVAVVIGTPGCEVGVLGELARRLRREPGSTEVLFCLVGLHRLDAWEARQPWHRRRMGPG